MHYSKLHESSASAGATREDEITAFYVLRRAGVANTANLRPALQREVAAALATERSLARGAVVDEIKLLIPFAADPAALNALEQVVAWLTRPPAPGPPDPPPMPFKGVA